MVSVFVCLSDRLSICLSIVCVSARVSVELVPRVGSFRACEESGRKTSTMVNEPDGEYVRTTGGGENCLLDC